MTEEIRNEALNGNEVEMQTQTAPSPQPIPSWVRAYLKLYKKPMVVTIALGIVTALFSVLMMFSAGYLIGRTAETGVVLLSVMTPIACVQLFGIGKPLAQYFERLASHDWVFRVTSDLRRKLYVAIERAATATGNDRSLGEVLSVLADDIGHLQNLYLRVVFPSIIAYIVYVVIVIAFGFFSVGVAFSMLIVLGSVVFLVPPMYAYTVRSRSRNARYLTGELYGDLADNVIGSTDWIISGRGVAYSSLVAQSSATLRGLKARIRRTERITNLLTVLLLGGGAWLTLIWAGSIFGIPEGTGEVSLITAFAFGFFPLIEIFGTLNGARAMLDVQYDAIDRLDSIIGHEDDAETHALDMPASDSAQQAAVSVDDVTFAYPGTESPVLSNLSFRLEKGCKVAVLGKSGSGKTTLVSLIRGDIAPQSGSVSLFGKAPAAYGEELSDTVAYVEQRPYLFNRTLRENLTLGSPEATDEQLVDVLAQVGLSEFLDNLEHGLDTIVDEAGMNFSGGERHRIALARVLLSPAPLVIFDEPTVGLDPATESDLFDAFLEKLADRTIIVVTHHLACIERFDRIVFVEDGAIAIDGNPRELVTSNERIAELVSFDRAHLE